MIWRKYRKGADVEYSASCGPVTFWISDTDGGVDTVIHYGGKTENTVLDSIEAAKAYCKCRAILLIKETLSTIQALDNSAEWEPK